MYRLARLWGVRHLRYWWLVRRFRADGFLVVEGRGFALRRGDVLVYLHDVWKGRA